jgi:hypothetical protein
VGLLYLLLNRSEEKLRKEYKNKRIKDESGKVYYSMLGYAWSINTHINMCGMFCSLCYS